MAGRNTGDFLRHSVLDRLTQEAGAGSDLRIGVQELRFAVLRDVEALLNSRRPLLGDLAGLPEVESSLMSYGIPDVSQFSAADAQDIHTLMDLIAATLRRFEPRLLPESIRVRPVESEDEYGARMHLRIEAILHVEPIHEPITFDTQIDMERGDVAVEVAD
jgi:type VI secretion system protein ImpF